MEQTGSIGSLLAATCSRRQILVSAVMAAGVGMLSAASAAAPDPAVTKDWLSLWEKSILSSARQRYCDKEMGEELGWMVSPFLNGFYYGHLATGDVKWVEMLIDWADAWIKRGVKEPDGYVGWPKDEGASTSVMPALYTDNILGEAMALRPVVLMAGVIQKTPALKAKYGDKAPHYIALAEQIFAKWDSRGCWREVKEGGVWVVPPFGIDRKTGQWTEGYARRQTDGFTLPANKQNEVTLWLLAMHDVTGKAIYRERAGQWASVMKSRMQLREGKYYVWNYWDPAGPWDYKPDGSPKHWVGVHPNGGYYGIDAGGIVAAWEHKLIFTREDIDRLIATNRDFMWDQQVQGAKFGRIDGGKPDARWKNGAGVLWFALTPYDATLRKVFEANHKPDGWGGLAATPRYLARK